MSASAPKQSERINSGKDLKVYKAAYDLAMKVFEISKSFPPEERYALTSQIRGNRKDAWKYD